LKEKHPAAKRRARASLVEAQMMCRTWSNNPASVQSCGRQDGRDGKSEINGSSSGGSSAARSGWVRHRVQQLEAPDFIGQRFRIKPRKADLACGMRLAGHQADAAANRQAIPIKGQRHAFLLCAVMPKLVRLRRERVPAFAHHFLFHAGSGKTDMGRL
jgi:hypothetical protein